MGTGYAIHIGLNRVDPDSYAGWDGRLRACVNDARAMDAIARPLGYVKSYLLLDNRATADGVLNLIGDIRSHMKSGDLLKITYSGHGGQMPDPWGIYGTVETWCAYDRQILGHEMAQIWAAMPAGARVCVVSDSCHAGTVTRAYEQVLTTLVTERGRRLKSIPAEVQQAIDMDQGPQLQRLFRGVTPPRAACPVYLLAACASNQLSSDGEVNGLYTEKLLRIWRNGAWRGDYPTFQTNISRLMPPWQTPSLFLQGPVNLAYYHSRPFTI